MIGRVLALTAALLLAMNFAAYAQDDEDEDEEEEYYYDKESSPYVALGAGGGAIGGDGTGNISAIVGGHVDTWIAFEGEYQYVTDSSTHLVTYSTKLLPLPDSRIQPYVKLGLGLMGGRSGHPFLFMGRFGAGVSFFLTETLALDAGANAGIASHDNNIYTGTLGLIYYFE
jgi:hypothetical protein